MIIYFVYRTLDKISNLDLGQFYKLYNGIQNELLVVQVAFGCSSLAVVDTAIVVAAVAFVAVAIAAAAVAVAIAAADVAVESV